MNQPGDWVYGVHSVSAVLTEDPQRVRVVYLQRGRRDARLQALRETARAAGVRLDLSISLKDEEMIG